LGQEPSVTVRVSVWLPAGEQTNEVLAAPGLAKVPAPLEVQAKVRGLPSASVAAEASEMVPPTPMLMGDTVKAPMTGQLFTPAVTETEPVVPAPEHWRPTVTAVVEFSQPVRHVRSRLALPGKLESDVSASYGRLTNVLSTSSSPI
jgi:hypothetical protein